MTSTNCALSSQRSIQLAKSAKTQAQRIIIANSQLSKTKHLTTISSFIYITSEDHKRS